MSIHVSEKLNNLLFVLIGERMLQGDEDKADANGKPYGRLARRMRELSDLIGAVAGGVGRSLPPRVGNNYVRAMHMFLDDGGVNHLKAFAKQLDDLERSRVKSGMDIMEAKWQIIAELVRLLIELMVIAVLSAFTGGTASSQAAVARARSTVAILTVMHELNKRTHAVPAVSEMFEEAFQTFAVRLAMMKSAPPGRRPDGFDWNQIVQDGVFGAFTGLFYGFLNDILKGLKKNFKNLSNSGLFKDVPGSNNKFDIKIDGSHNNYTPNPTPHPHADPHPGPEPKPNPHPDLTSVPPPSFTPVKLSPIDRFKHELGEDAGHFLTEGGAEALGELATAAIFHFPTEGLTTFLGGGLSSVSERHLGQGASWLGGKFNFKKPPNVNTVGPDDVLGSKNDDTSSSSSGSSDSPGGGAPSPGPGSSLTVPPSTTSSAPGAGQNRPGSGSSQTGADGNGITTEVPGVDLDDLELNGPRPGAGHLDPGHLDTVPPKTSPGTDGNGQHADTGTPANGTPQNGTAPGSIRPGSTSTQGQGQGNNQDHNDTFDDADSVYDDDSLFDDSDTETDLDSIFDGNPGNSDSDTESLFGDDDAVTHAGGPDTDHTKGTPNPGDTSNTPLPTTGTPLPHVTSPTGSPAPAPGNASNANGTGAGTGGQSSGAPNSSSPSSSPTGGGTRPPAPVRTDGTAPDTDGTTDATGTDGATDLDETTDTPGIDTTSGANDPGTTAGTDLKGGPTGNTPGDVTRTEGGDTGSPVDTAGTAPAPAPAPVATTGRGAPSTTGTGNGTPQDVHGKGKALDTSSDTDTSGRGTDTTSTTTAPDGPHGADVSDLDVSEARDQHIDAVRELKQATDDAARIRTRIDAGEGGNRDLDALDAAQQRVDRAEQHLYDGEDRLRDLGIDPHAPESFPHPAPVVARDDSQRQWIASQVTADDLPDGLPTGLDPHTTVTLRDLTAAGVTVGPALHTQFALGNGEVSLRDTGLDPVDQVKVLMNRPGPWPQSLDTVAADTSRRIWQDSYEDFTGSLPPGTDPRSAREAWDRATGLVLPLELHPVRADSRYTTDPFRDAVRQVADLLAGGSGRPAAITRADQLRTDLGLPFRVRGGAPGVDTALDGPQPVPTTSNDSDPTPPTSVPPLVSTTSPSTTPPSTTSVDVPGVGRSVTVGGDPEAPGDPYGSYDATYSGVSQETADWAHGVLRDLVGGEPDLDVLAGQLLHLGPGVQADAATVDRLYELVEAADTAGRATSLAAIGAFDLDQRGALDDQWLVRDTGGRRVGRDWTGNAGRPRVDRYLRVSPDGRTASVDAPWPQQRWVVSAEGGPEGPWVRDRDDNVLVPNSWAEFAELLRHDPAWRQRGDLVIAVPQAGSQTLEGPSLVSDLLRVRTWSTNGTLDWNGRTRSGDPLIRVTGTAVVWVPNRPGQRSGAIPGSVRDIYGSLIDDRDIASTTMVSGDGQRSYGRSMLASDDPVRRAHGNVGGQIMHFSYGEVEPGPGRSWRIIQESAAVHPLPFRPGYVMNFHGSATTGEIPLEEDDPTEAPLGEVAGFFGRRGSFQAVRPRDIVFAEGCEVADYPPGTNDPLHHPRGLQHMANTLNRPVAAANRTIIIRPPADGRPARFVVQTQDVRNPGEVRWITAYPEPDHDEFLEIAARIGGRLPQTPSPRQLLTWLRAAREVYGPDFGPDSQGFDLTMQALGLIDFQRISQGGTGPLTLPWLGEFTQPYNQAYNYPADSWNGLRWLIHNMSSTTTGGDPQAPTDVSDTSVDTTSPAGPADRADALPPPGVPYGVDNSVATSVLERGGQDWWRARAAAGDPVLRQHTWTSVNRQTPDMNGVLQPTTVHGTFRVRRFTHNDVNYTDIEVRTALTTRDPLTAQQLADLWTQLSADIDAVYNTPGHKLPNGDILHVTPVRVAHGDPDTDWLADVYTPAPGKRPSHHRLPVNLRAGSRIGAHEFGHQVGLPDEYTNPNPNPGPDTDSVQGINISGSLMGRYNQPIDPTELETYEREAAEGRPTLTGDGLAQGGLRDRNLGRIARFVGDLPTSTPRITPPPTGLPDETLTGLTDFHTMVDRALRTTPDTTGITDNALDAYNDFNNLLETTLRSARTQAGLDTPPPTAVTVGGDPEAPGDPYGSYDATYSGVSQETADWAHGVLRDLVGGEPDLDVLAGQLLHLGPGVQADAATVDRLYELVEAADTAGRATSLAAIGAFDLDQRGALDDQWLVRDTGGRRVGRDWTGNAGRPRVDRYLRVSPDGRTASVDAPWPQQRWVVSAEGGPEGPWVRDRDDNVLVPNSWAEFAELLRHDPAWRQRGDLVIAVPQAGSQTLEGPSLVSDLLRVRTWSTNGTLDWNGRTRSGDPLIRVTGTAVVWVPNRPGQRSGAIPGSVRDIYGSLIDDRDIASTTMVSGDGQRSYGRSMLASDDPVRRAHGNVGGQIMHFSYGEVEPGPGRSWRIIQESAAVHPLPFRPGYVMNFHGSATTGEIPLEEDDPTEAPLGEVAGFFGRRGSFQAVRPRDIVFAEGCEVADYPPGTNDPLHHPRGLQHMANTLNRPVAAANRTIIIRPPADGRPARFVVQTQDVRNPGEVRWITAYPEPDHDEFLEIAARIGGRLPQTPSPRQLLTWLRAAREVYGPDFGPDSQGFDLTMQALGLIDFQRISQGGTGPLTLPWLGEFTQPYNQAYNYPADSWNGLRWLIHNMSSTTTGGDPQAPTDASDTNTNPDIDTTRPAGLDGGFDAVPPPDVPHGVDNSVATSVLERGGQDWWRARAAAGDPVLRQHTWTSVNRQTPDMNGVLQPTTVHGTFRVRRFTHNDVTYTDIEVRTALTTRDPLTAQQLADLWTQLSADIDAVYNTPGHKLPNGDILHVTPVRVAHGDPDTDWLADVYTPAPGKRPSHHRIPVNLRAGSRTGAHEFGHQVGLPDEYTNPNPGPDTDSVQGINISGSLMGRYNQPIDPAELETYEREAAEGRPTLTGDGMAQGGLRDRNLGRIARFVGDLPTSTPRITPLPTGLPDDALTGLTDFHATVDRALQTIPTTSGITDDALDAYNDFNNLLETTLRIAQVEAGLDTPPLTVTTVGGDPQAPVDTYEGNLIQIFGPGVTQLPGYQDMHDALARLDTLRGTDSDPALRQGPLDLDAVTRRVLVLPPGTPLSTGHYDALFRFTTAPDAAQAPSLAAIAAVGLVMRGAMSTWMAVKAPDDTPYGRDWGSSLGADRSLDMDLDSVWQDNGAPSWESRTTDPRPAPWSPAAGRPRPYVIKTGGSPYALTVLTLDGATTSVPVDVFAELLALDPALTALPPDVPVLLLVPHAGGRQLELPRALAHRLDRPVWSTSGNPETQKADDGKVRVFLEKRTGLPVGDWITSRPGEVMSDPTTQTTDVPAWERNMVSYTVVADDDPTLQIGRAAFHPQDFSTRESIYRTIHRARLYARFYPAIRKETAPTPLTVGAAPGERVHHVLMHGAPDAVSVPQQDGSTYRASGEEITGWLKRRPSVKRLRDQDWIDFDLCFTGGAYRPGAARLIGSNVALPPATDPLAQPPLAQIVANGTRKRVRAADRVSAYAVNPSTGVPRFLLHADARGNDSRALEFWPEPLDTELADLARTAGLHTGPDPVPGHTLDTTLRLVRALRHAFGPGIGPGFRQDPTYPDLLHGIGALEKMRDNDPHLRDITPFTLELFTRAARADRRDHGDGRDVLDADTYRGLLTRAATAPPNTSLSDFVQIPLSVRAADQLRNLPHVAALATRLLQLPPSAPVGAAEMTRLYWAYVEAAEWIQSVPDIGATAAAALHLPTPDPALQGRLVELATAVIAAGLNPRNPAELGAFDLVLRGALGDHSLYFDPSGRPVGRNWSAPQPGQVVDSSAVLTATRQPQGTYGLTGSAQAPWVDQGKHGFVVSAQNAGPGRVRIALPGMPPVDVTNAEVAELLALDPALAVRDLRTTQVVLAVHGSGGSTAPATGMPPVPPSIDASLPLRFAVALSTGRTVWAPQGRLQVAPLPNSGHSSLTGIFDTPGTTAAADFVPTSPDFWIPAAAVSAAPLAPTHSDGSVTSQPPSQPQDPYRDHLVRSFGTDIVQSPRYQQLHDAVGRLDTLRANDSDPALRQGPLDLDAVTRRVLVLDAATPLTTEHYDMALLFAGAPGAAQASGLATIAAIGLAMRGALSGGLALTSPDGTRYGRDWGSGAAADRTVDLDLDSVWQDNGAQSGRSRTTDPRPAPWRPAAGKPRPYVIKTGGSPYALTVTTPNDDRMTVPVDVFAELLALDPALTALPPDVPVVLLVPHAGGRQLELPRALAHRLNRPVWSTSGNPDTQKADDGKVRVFLEKRTGLPVGDWIPSRPDEVMSDPTTQTTDVPAWERDMVSYTVVADDDPTLQIGRAVLDPSDFATREATYRKLNQDYLLHRYVSSARALKQGVRPRVGAAPGEPVHHVFMHGTPEYVQVPQKDGSVYPASGEEITGWLKRRPSVSRLGDRGWINFDACWTGGAYRHGAYKRTHSDAPLPRAVDPLTTIPLSQVVANGTRKRVRAGDRVNGYDLDPDTGKPRWFVFDDVRGGLAHTVEYYPEPLDTELADLARTAGLHTGPDPVPGHTLDTTLRLVRALRQTFGPRVGEDPSYHDLVRGIGAVERMRSDDPQLKDVAPFTLDLFKRAAAANRRDHGDGRVLLNADAYRAFLARAVTAPPGTALSDFVTLPMPVWVAGQIRTMRDPAAFARRALQLPPSAPVGTTEMTQAYWAFVKASEWFQSLPDRGTTAAVALHLPAPDSSPSRGLQLVDLAMKAFAAGHDPHNVMQLAAFDLTLRGAFDTHSQYVDSSGRVVGRNWGRQRPHQTQQLDSSALVTLTQRADGSYARSGPDTAPWAGPDTDPYLVSTKDNGHGRYRVTLRGGQHVDVPRAELAELLALDPDLLRRNATTTQVVLNVSRTGGSPAPAGDPLATAPPPLAPTMPLQHAVALATGRTVWAPKGTSEVRQFPGTGHLSLTGVFDAPGTKAASDFVPVFPDFWASNATTSAAPPPPTHAGGTTPSDSAAPTAGLPYVSSDGGVTTAGPTAPDSDAEDGYVADHTDLLSEEGPPPTVAPPPRTQVESSYVRRYGALPDGSVGLVQLPAFSPEVLAGLHEQVYSELGVDPDNPPADVREQVEDRLSGAQLALNLAYVRSAGGHRVTIRVDGTDHTIDVQLTLSHPRPSTRQGLFDTRDPDKHVERRGFGTRETYSGQPSGTYRTFQAPWTGSWPIGAGTAVRAVDGAATASITHNQASDSATVTYSVQTTTSQRSNEPSDPIEFDTHWRVRRDAPNVPEAAASAARTGTPAPTSVASEGWSAPQSHGPTTIWFPRHLTAADPAPDSLPEPADLHELPLYGVDSVIDPGALYEHVHRSFRADLDDTAAEQVSTFLSEQVVRGTLPMQIDEGLHSPVITDGSGNVVGMLRLETTPVVAPAQRQSVEGQINLESHVVNYSKVSLSSKYTSGIAITGNVAAALTGDHSEGHPHSADTIGGSAGARGQAQINVSNTYGAESSSGTMHAVRTNRSHLLAPAAVGYRVTLIRPDGTESPAPVFSPKHGMDLRVLSKADAEGHRPSDEELRELPDSLEHLDGLGLSAAPLDVTGTAALYDRAEAWLRREGFLPPAPGTPAATGLGAKLKKLARDHEPEHQIRLHAQLNNLRKLRDARSRVGRRAGSDSMIDGGQSLHFEIPTGTDTGVRRVRLQLTAERDTSRESRHDKVLPGIQVMGLALGVGSDSEQLGESYGGGAGPLGSVSGPLGNWGGFGFGGDYQYVHQYTDGDGVGGSTGHDQFFIGTAQDTHKFEVPVRLALDLFADDGDRPSVRFGEEVNAAAAAAATPAAPAVPTASTASAAPAPPTVSGSMWLAVPHSRTRAPAPKPAPRPRAGHAGGVPRRPNPTDMARLEGTDATGAPLPNLVRVPDDALIDVMRGSAVVDSLFQRAAAEIRRQVRASETAADDSGTGPILPLTTADAGRTTGTGDGRQSRKWTSPLAGQGLTDTRTRAAESRYAATTPGSLIAHGHELLKNTYVVEGLTLPGALSDGQYTLELRAIAHDPELLGTDKQYTETGAGAVDTAQQSKSLGKSHQVGFTGLASQNPPAVPENDENSPELVNPEIDGTIGVTNRAGTKSFVGLFNPSARFGYTFRTDESDALSSSTAVNRVPTESGEKHRVKSGLTYVLTLRAGSRTAFNGPGELGTIDPVTFAADVPGGLEFLMTRGQHLRDARWMSSVRGLTAESAPKLTAGLPSSYTRDRELGLGTVLSVIEYQRPAPAAPPAAPAPVATSGTAAPASTPAIPLGPVTPRERRGQVYRDMVELVEIEAPGATTPGHPGYQSGVHSRIAQITSTAGLRSLPGRGPGGTFGRATTRFHFRHHGFGGERLVEVALAAVPRRSQDLAGVRGVSHPGSGFEQWQSHTAAGRTTSKSWVRQKQLGVNLTTRHLRRNQPPGQSRVDRSAPVLTPQAATSKSSRRATTADNRFWLRTDNGADFDGLEYDYVVSVRSVLVMDWPPNVLGGLIQNGVIAWEQASVNTRRWLDELLERGRPQTRSTPVRLALRFTGTETNTRTTPASVTAPAAVSTVDPRNRLLPGPPPTPYLTDSQMFSPTGPTPVFHFDGWAHLETALNEVTPISEGGWHVQLTGASLEGRAARLGQLVQAGRISLDRPRLVAGLLRRMPGSRPLEGPPTQPPSLTITLYNPRRATHGDDVTLDQLHNVTDTLSTAAGADHTFSVGFTELLSADADGHQLAGMSVPIVQRPAQPTSFGGTVTGSRRDWLKHGSTSAPGDGARGTRSYAIDADVHLLVEGPEGTRHVTGTATLRVEERDLLGHGLITEEESPPRVRDLPSLVPDWDTGELSDLSQRLHSALNTEVDGVQLWVSLGPDQDGVRLGRVLYGASRAAVLGNRPVELMTRGPEGIRRWEFNSEGSLVTDDPQLTEAWTPFHAQAQLLHSATLTLADAPGQLRRLTMALRHADHALTHAVVALESARDMVRTAITAEERAKARAALSIKTARQHRKLVGTLEQGLKTAQQTVATLPPVIAANEKTAADARRDLRTALDRLTQVENTVRAERAAAAAKGSPTRTGQDAQGVGSAVPPAGRPAPPAPSESPAATGAPRSGRPAADVADDPRVRAVLPAITAAENTLQEVTKQLEENSGKLRKAQKIVTDGPARVQEAQTTRDEAVEQAGRDAAAVVSRGEDVRIARLRESRAEKRVERAETKVLRRNDQLATAADAQARALSDHSSATEALEDLSTAVRDNAPAPEQSLRTTFATTSPRWPRPGGRLAPLPAAGQSHSAIPRATTDPARITRKSTFKLGRTGTAKPTHPDIPKITRTGTSKPTHTMPAHSGTVATGKGKEAAAAPVTRETPYIAPRGALVPTPGDNRCLLSAVIGSAPQLVRTRLQEAGLPVGPRVATWLGRPTGVQQTLRNVALNSGGGRDARHLRTVQDQLQNLVQNRLAAAIGGTRPLSPQVLGQLRSLLVTEFAAQVRDESDAWVDARLIQFGIGGLARPEDLDPTELQTLYAVEVSRQDAPHPAAGESPSNVQMFDYLRRRNALPALPNLTPEQRRELLITEYHHSTVPLTTPEANRLNRAVRNWSTEWNSLMGDVFLPLLADTLDAPIDVFTHAPGPVAEGGTLGFVIRYGPDSHTPALEVHYTGLNHYSASAAATHLSLAPPTAGPPSSLSSAREDSIEPPTPTMEGSSVGSVGDGSRGEDDGPAPVSYGERPDSFVASLASLLTGPGTAPAWAGARDPQQALRGWALSDAADRGVPADAALPDGDTDVSYEDLDRLKVLDDDQLRAQAILQGSLTVAEAGLDDAARLALVLANPDTLAYVLTLAALVARDTGRRIRLVPPGGGEVREFGPAGGTPLTVYFDGDRFTTTPPAPDDD